MKEFDHAIAVLLTAKELAEEDAARGGGNEEIVQLKLAKAKSCGLAIMALKREYRKVGSSTLAVEGVLTQSFDEETGETVVRGPGGLELRLKDGEFRRVGPSILPAEEK